jgi:hypothetical protein
MKLKDLRTELRERVGDTVVPYLVSNARLTAFANWAQQEAARRARLITDSEEPETCRIDLTANVASYDLDPRVIRILRARLVGRSAYLRRISRKDLDPRGSSWEDETGEPQAYVPDVGSRKFRPWPMPEESGVVWLTVLRLPLVDMVGDEDVPELAEHAHMALVDGMEHRFYTMPDRELRNEERAAAALARFEREFGGPVSVIEDTYMEEHQQFSDDEGQF